MFCEVSSFAQNSEPMTDYSTMIRENVEELYRFLEETVSDSDMTRIKDAFELALDAHKNQYRKSGLPYIIHPIAVALIVAKELELGPNPIIAALYTFFFASFLGTQVTRAVLTTGILCGAIALLRKFGIAALSIASGALVAYIPFLMVLILVWYVVNKLL